MIRSVAERYKICVALLCTLYVASDGARLYADDNEDPDVVAGRALFNKSWEHDSYEDPVLEGTNIVGSNDEVGDGLGPMHNATSCVQCHHGGGASAVHHNVIMLTLDPRSPVFDKSNVVGAVRRELVGFFPGVFSSTGQLALDTVVHNKSTREGYQVYRRRVKEHVLGGAPDAWYEQGDRTSNAIAENPVLAGRMESIDYYISQRNSPPLYGLGLIDQIPNKVLDALAERQQKRKGDGISGRRGNGKFGWRAQTTSLASFVRGACTGELGLSQQRVVQPMDPADWQYANPGIDITEKQCQQLTKYVASIDKPTVNKHSDRHAVREGRRQFYKIGCVSCHVENVDKVTGLFSDLLLHDMGSRLQAPSPAPAKVSANQKLLVRSYIPSGSKIFGGFSSAGYYGTPPDQFPLPFAMDSPRPINPIFPRVMIPLENDQPVGEAVGTWDAAQREWRTPPLWGLAHTGPYLHDGRAVTIDQAIRWHGGEAAQSVANYEKMADRHRHKLLTFLSSLVSPGDWEAQCMCPVGLE